MKEQMAQQNSRALRGMKHGLLELCTITDKNSDEPESQRIK